MKSALTLVGEVLTTSLRVTAFSTPMRSTPSAFCRPVRTCRTRRHRNLLLISTLSLTLAISGWVAGSFGEAVEERAWDCCHVLGLRGR